MSERLEEAKKTLNEYIKAIDEHFGCPPSDIVRLEYIIQQAERTNELETALKGAHDIAKIQAAHVEELEKENEAYLFDIDHAKYHRVISDNQRYKQALEESKQHLLTGDIENGATKAYYAIDEALKGESND